MKSLRKRTLTGIIVIMTAGVVFAAVSSNYELISNVIAPSGSGNLEAVARNMIATSGESISGIAESNTYSLAAGFVATSVVITKAAGSLDAAYVYPNPVKPGSGGDYDSSLLTFAALTENISIDIYNIAGERVKSINKNSTEPKVEWNLKNDAGRSLASGVYIYIIEDSDEGDIKKGKFAIVK